MKGTVFTVLLIVIVMTVLLSRAEELSGRRAAEYINGFTEKFSGRQYSALILQRRNRSTKTGGMVDAVVFIPSPGESSNNKYHFIRRLDDDYVVRLHAREGKEPEVVAPGDISRYQKMIKDNDMSPFVVLDRDGTEILIVYCGLRPCSIAWKRKQNGEIIVEVYETFKDREYRGAEFFPVLPAL